MSKFYEILAMPKTAADWALFSHRFKERVPVQHLSPSAIKSLMIDQCQFDKSYIRKDYDALTPLRMVEGSASHKVIEWYWLDRMAGNPINNETINTYIKKAQQYVMDECAKERVRLSSTEPWDQEEELRNALRSIEKAGQYYVDHAEINMLNVKPLAVENSITTTFVNSAGITMPIPIKCKLDLLAGEYVDDGKVVYVRDHKTCRAYTDKSDFSLDYLIQAVSNYYAVANATGHAIKWLIFDEIKTTQNRVALTKADLVALAEKTEKPKEEWGKMKVDELKQFLALNGFADDVATASQVKSIHIEIKPEHLAVFDEIYRRALYQIYLLYTVGEAYLPNPISYDPTGSEEFVASILEKFNQKK